MLERDIWVFSVVSVAFVLRFVFCSVCVVFILWCFCRVFILFP